MNHVSEAIFKVLGERQRIRQQTDLTALYRRLKREDKGLEEQSFLDTFRDLQAQGMGSLVIGRRGNPNRFVWKYSLKEVADRALAKKNFKDLKPLDKSSRLIQFKDNNAKPRAVKRRGRPAIVKTRSQRKTVMSVKPMLQIVINVPENTPQSEVSALVDLAKGLNKK